MGLWDDVARQARQCHDAARAAGAGLHAHELLRAAAALTGVPCYPVAPADPGLDGAEALYDAAWGVILVNRAVPPRRAAFYVAHEYAHVWLDGAGAVCHGTSLDAGAPPEEVARGARQVEGYSLHERREREASAFAREFLLPRDTLRRWFLHERLGAPAIATRAGVPESLVHQQLALALLVPDTAAEAAAAPPEDAQAATPTAASEPMSDDPHDPTSEQAPLLDESQRAAAEAPTGPLLVQAGPGTGKTRTLVARVLHLLERGVPPARILALTFSNRAAEEMRERVARAVPAAAPHIWMGTFHAFGLELLRKYGASAGLARFDLVDSVDALFLLEELLPALDLDHYQNLYEPTMHLRALLAAISRAKDELCGPAEYTAHAQAALRAATGADEVEAAEKACEAARVYAIYQRRLDGAALVDFGDLIRRAVSLLRDHAGVRDAVRQSYRHILVDEYQDVNHASTELLRLLAGDGAGLWVVGDARQAIYRFRGAAPINMRQFARNFPGAAVLSLDRNYRSQPAIVRTLAEMAPRMRAARGLPFRPWAAARSGADGAVTMQVTRDLEEEGALLAREIAARHDAGLPYGAQAVLCRTHTVLARLGALLERAGIPLLYLGDLFERAEVRDLLSLLALACEDDGRGLVRVAGFPDYRIPPADVRLLLRAAKEREEPFPRALHLAPELEGLSARGRAGLVLLARHLEGICDGGPWALLARYLFERGAYLRPLLADNSSAARQRRLALYQFLQVVQTARTAPGQAGQNATRALLRYIRRLEVFGEETHLRQAPAWAMGIDAVPLLTIHASKGLEFDAVYLPALAEMYLPGPARPEECPPPAGMPLHHSGDEHLEEEECLFFVALSRARDTLVLSRAHSYRADGAACHGSRFLHLVAHAMPQPAAPTDAGPPNRDGDETPAPDTPLVPRVFDAEELEGYRRCPRQYAYEYLTGLGRQRDDSAYVRFHRCVYAVLRWLAAERAAGRPVDEAATLAWLGHVWAEQGPADHAYAAIYRRSAEAMVARSLLGGAPVPAAAWTVERPLGRIALTPDHVEWREIDGVRTLVAQRLRTGRPSKSEAEKDVYALYREAARGLAGGAPWRVEIRYLSSGQIDEVTLSERAAATRLGHYDTAMAGILSGRFPPRPTERDCPRCPHYFICPAPAEG